MRTTQRRAPGDDKPDLPGPVQESQNPAAGY